MWLTASAVFVAACLLFGAVLAVPYLWDSSAKPMEVMGTQGKQRSLLLFVHDGAGELTGAVAVQTDTAEGIVQVIGYPKQTEVTYGTSVCTLSECYAAEKTEAAACLAAATGGSYGSVWSFSTRSLGQLAAWPNGGVTLALTEAAGLLSVGEQTVSAVQLAELLEHTNWGEPVVKQAEMHAVVVALFLERHLQPQTDLEAAFKAVTALCDDRMTIAHYKNVERELAALAEQTARVTAVVPLGKTVGVSS